jgi:hypothetical protein
MVVCGTFKHICKHLSFCYDYGNSEPPTYYCNYGNGSREISLHDSCDCCSVRDFVCFYKVEKYNVNTFLEGDPDA